MSNSCPLNQYICLFFSVSPFSEWWKVHYATSTDEAPYISPVNSTSKTNVSATTGNTLTNNTSPTSGDLSDDSIHKSTKWIVAISVVSFMVVVVVVVGICLCLYRRWKKQNKPPVGQPCEEYPLNENPVVRQPEQEGPDDIVVL